MPAWTERDWDHERNLRKHEPRPTDKPRHRLDRPLTTAEDIAALVKMLPMVESARLIDQYAQMVAAGARVEEAEIVANRITGALNAQT